MLLSSITPKSLTVWTGAMRLPKRLNFILNKAKLPTTTVKPNQFRFRWVKLESIRGHPSTNRISTISESLQHNLFRTNIHVTVYLQIISIGMGQQTKTTNQLHKIRGVQQKQHWAQHWTLRHTIIKKHRDIAITLCTDTCWLLPVKYDENHSSAEPRIPKLISNRLSRIEWSTVSKAALRSNMPKSDICPLSKAASISVTTLRTAVSVEKNCR